MLGVASEPDERRDGQWGDEAMATECRVNGERKVRVALQAQVRVYV
jgi:hypothetical protein